MGAGGGGSSGNGGGGGDGTSGGDGGGEGGVYSAESALTAASPANAASPASTTCSTESSSDTTLLTRESAPVSSCPSNIAASLGDKSVPVTPRPTSTISSAEAAGSLHSASSLSFPASPPTAAVVCCSRLRVEVEVGDAVEAVGVRVEVGATVAALSQKSVLHAMTVMLRPCSDTVELR